MSDDLKRGDRVVVQMSKTRKYGTVTGESKDRTCWLVLIDGNRQVNTVVKSRCERLKPTQLAFNLGRVK